MKGGLDKLVNLVALSLPFIKVPVQVNADAVINNNKVTDHHAILPTLETRKTDFDTIPTGERGILQMLIVRLVCAVAPQHEYEAVTVTVGCGDHRFTAKGRSVLAAGWKEYDHALRECLRSKPDEDGEDDCAKLPELSKGQTFERVTATVKEGATAPPKHYTEDTLLSAMETAGKEDMPEDAERRGLGTPATRAAIIEKLIKAGFAERKKKNLLPTDKGRNLISVLPETLKSAKLTAKWEHMLQQVQYGAVDGGAFMDSIAAFISDIVRDNKAPNPEFTKLFTDTKHTTSEPLGACPRCGQCVREGERGYFCDNRACGFKIWRDSKFWTTKKKPLTAGIVSELLTHGRVALKGLYSGRTGKEYDATVLLDDTGDGFVNFKLLF